MKREQSAPRHVVARNLERPAAVVAARRRAGDHVIKSVRLMLSGPTVDAVQESTELRDLVSLAEGDRRELNEVRGAPPLAASRAC